MDASQHAQADARPRRAAHGRRDHARRVPRAHREGPGAGAALPAGARRRAVRRGHHRDPARPQGPLRGAPQGADQRRRAGRRRDAVRPLHHLALPARQGDRPGRRGRLPAADGDRLAARSRSTSCSARSTGCGWRSWRSSKETRRRPSTASGWSGCARDLADKQEELAALNARWEQEKAGLNRVGELKARLDELRGQAERAQRDGDFETASRLLYAEIPALERGARRGRARPARTPRGDGQGGGRPRRRRRGRRVLDRHPGRPAARGRDREAAADGGRARPPAGRPDRGRARGVRRRTPRPRRASPTPTGRPARSSSSARPVSARPSWPRRSPTSSSTTSGRWSAST